MGTKAKKENENSVIDPEKDKKAKQAAYALNMCTVSISQILDYNDPVIMEQEYDGILNNLNIQNMPKESDALLDILEKIMDTITFFRISEKEKAFVDREYQENMKNAIWEAVPNFGMIVSGEPITMLVSLATQVGMGYMNYRRAKNEKTLQYDREMWQLERAAIEQINSLQKQLFETAWRLSQTYDYEDQYRLTERQIKQYNEILMDVDYERKYERLDSIKDRFEAYPPFWYHLANTAHLIYCDYKDDEDTKAIADVYLDRAGEYYEKYLNISEYPLLREDPMKASCCLEFIDILDPQIHRNKIDELLEMAIQSAGGRLDLIQLIVFSYFSVGDTVNVKKTLIKLVNEGYNAATNAQLLSRIYVEEYINHLQNNDGEAAAEVYSLYKILSNRVNNSYLMPFPDSSILDINVLLMTFENNQRQILMKNYFYAFKEFFENKSHEFNRMIPVYTDVDYVPDEYYSNDRTYVIARQKHAKDRFKKDSYTFNSDLYDSEFWKNYMRLFDEIADEVDKLTCVTDIDSAVSAVEEKINEHKQTFFEVKNRLMEGSLTYENGYGAIAKISFYKLFGSFIKEICYQVAGFIKELPKVVNGESEITIQNVEKELRNFCVRNNLSSPEELFDNNDSATEINNKRTYFEEELLGEDDENEKNHRLMNKEMLDLAEKAKPELFINDKKNKINVILKTDPELKLYFSKVKNSYGLMNKTIFVIDDKSSFDKDLVFATDGIYSVVHKKIVSRTAYDDSRIGEKLSDKKLWIDGINKPVPTLVDFAITAGLIMTQPGIGIAYATGGKAKQVIVGDYYENKQINIDKLYKLITNLTEVARKYVPKDFSDIISSDSVYENIYKAAIAPTVKEIGLAEKFGSVCKNKSAVFKVRLVGNMYLTGTVIKGSIKLWDIITAYTEDGEVYTTKVMGIKAGNNPSVECAKEGDEVWLKIQEDSIRKRTYIVVKE